MFLSHLFLYMVLIVELLLFPSSRPFLRVDRSFFAHQTYTFLQFEDWSCVIGNSSFPVCLEVTHELIERSSDCHSTEPACMFLLVTR